MPEKLLRQPGPLRSKEIDLMHTHVELGVDIVASGGINDPDVLDAVRRLNEINRRLRNLIATNVQNRLSAFTGSGAPYSAMPRQK